MQWKQRWILKTLVDRVSHVRHGPPIVVCTILYIVCSLILLRRTARYSQPRWLTILVALLVLCQQVADIPCSTSLHHPHFLAHPAFRPKMSWCHCVASVVCCLSSVHNSQEMLLLLMSWSWNSPPYSLRLYYLTCNSEDCWIMSIPTQLSQHGESCYQTKYNLLSKGLDSTILMVIPNVKCDIKYAQYVIPPHVKLSM